MADNQKDAYRIYIRNYRAVFTCQAINPPFVIKHLGDGQSIVQIDEQKKFLLLPVEEASPEAKLYMIADNDVVRSMNVRLAVNKVDYFVPVDLTGFDNKHLSFNFQLIPDSAMLGRNETVG